MYIPFKKNAINIIANYHGAFLAAKRCDDALIITIRPPTVVEERYAFKSPIWLTYSPLGYENALSPDRLEFEVMDRIMSYVERGENVYF